MYAVTKEKGYKKAAHKSYQPYPEILLCEWTHLCAAGGAAAVASGADKAR